MRMSCDALEAAALELPIGERARLARRLIESLDDGTEDSPADVERAWQDESRRRLEEYDAGVVQAIPASEVFAEFGARPV